MRIRKRLEQLKLEESMIEMEERNKILKAEYEYVKAQIHKIMNSKTVTTQTRGRTYQMITKKLAKMLRSRLVVLHVFGAFLIMINNWI